MKVREYLESKGIDIARDDGSELACYCPFHSNADTPAFSINKYTGLWICFNPGCSKRGSIRDLMEFYGDKPSFVKESTYDEILELLKEPEAVKSDDSWAEVLDSIRLVFPGDEDKAQYLIDRGYTVETLEYFEVGYSSKKDRIVIPVRNEGFKVLGFVGRTVHKNVEPKYMNSKGLPKKDILFNLQNAKKFGSVVVTEGPLDACMVHQCGFPNVVATFGANVTDKQVSLLREYFDSIVIFSDNDAAGWSMRDIILRGCQGQELLIPEYPDRLIDTADGSRTIKDPGDLTGDEVVQCISEAKDFLSWSLR